MTTTEQNQTENISTKQYAPIIGREVTDMITSVRGRVIAATMSDSGHESYLVQQSRTDSDGYPARPVWLDRYLLENSGNLPDMKRHELLGQEVTDRVTGFEGTIISITYLHDSQCKVHIQGRNLTNKGIPSPPFICDFGHVEQMRSGERSSRHEHERVTA